MNSKKSIVFRVLFLYLLTITIFVVFGLVLGGIVGGTMSPFRDSVSAGFFGFFMATVLAFTTLRKEIWQQK
ncbi:hypothetical protein ACN08Z_05450 [Rothia sp. P7181]|uniref:hypothetical protein n=1 Tax=Rothia sp. P7181 TaxID=3402663 RepID=UPI003AE2FC32